ncbi:hypothetical protein K440DRAFT_642516 [Wilcoxina mikolae CBS 423.85]|nr:hypothetical protein K440DRAFT_642516 [Wilcoxina mikolae CBS 423.85]
MSTTPSSAANAHRGSDDRSIPTSTPTASLAPPEPNNTIGYRIAFQARNGCAKQCSGADETRPGPRDHTKLRDKAKEIVHPPGINYVRKVIIETADVELINGERHTPLAINLRDNKLHPWLTLAFHNPEVLAILTTLQTSRLKAVFKTAVVTESQGWRGLWQSHKEGQGIPVSISNWKTSDGQSPRLGVSQPSPAPGLTSRYIARIDFLAPTGFAINPKIPVVVDVFCASALAGFGGGVV